MSSTKIINVLKDDSFTEILGLFKATPAEEVIFVLPKRSRAFQKEDHFSLLKTEAKELGKKVSFLCSNPEINDLAKKHHFDVLLARSPVPRKKANSINVVNQIEEFYAEPPLDSDSISTSTPAEEEEPVEEEVVPVVAAVNNRRLDDVFVPETKDKQNVKVSGRGEKAMPVEVRQADFLSAPLEDRALKEIKSVWGTPAIRPEVRVASATTSLWKKFFQRSTSAIIFGSAKKRPSAHKTALVALACVAIVILGTVVVISTGKAQVTIKPASQPLDISLNVFTSDSVSSIDTAGLAIPGQLFNIPKTVSQNFPATGHVDVAQKARGTITVYNELSTDQQLIATTRFQSSDGHIFHTLVSITVPAAKTVSGKLVPGSKDVQVIADKAGSDYNVAVGLFTVPAFKEKGDTEKFQKIYGQSDASITSGTSGQATIISDTDLTAAKQSLTTQVIKDVQDELQSQINGLKIINTDQVVTSGAVSTGPVDATTNTFPANLTGSLKTVGFKESDLDSLISQYVVTKNNTTVLPDKLTIDYSNIQWNDSKNGLSFTIHVTGTAYAKLNISQIITDLLGKNDTQMKAYLSGVSGISSAHVDLSPFWVRSIPKNQAKVKVDISY